MTKAFHNDTRVSVIATNISCMKSLLENALNAVQEADRAMDTKERNLAIGCLLDIEPMLANAKALYDATIFIHRTVK